MTISRPTATKEHYASAQLFEHPEFGSVYLLPAYLPPDPAPDWLLKPLPATLHSIDLAHLLHTQRPAAQEFAKAHDAVIQTPWGTTAISVERINPHLPEDKRLPPVLPATQLPPPSGPLESMAQLRLRLPIFMRRPKDLDLGKNPPPILRGQPLGLPVHFGPSTLQMVLSESQVRREGGKYYLNDLLEHKRATWASPHEATITALSQALLRSGINAKRTALQQAVLDASLKYSQALLQVRTGLWVVKGQHTGHTMGVELARTRQAFLDSFKGFNINTKRELTVCRDPWFEVLL